MYYLYICLTSCSRKKRSNILSVMTGVGIQASLSADAVDVPAKNNISSASCQHCLLRGNWKPQNDSSSWQKLFHEKKVNILSSAWSYGSRKSTEERLEFMFSNGYKGDCLETLAQWGKRKCLAFKSVFCFIFPLSFSWKNDVLGKFSLVVNHSFRSLLSYLCAAIYFA